MFDNRPVHVHYIDVATWAFVKIDWTEPRIMTRKPLFFRSLIGNLRNSILALDGSSLNERTGWLTSKSGGIGCIVKMLAMCYK